MVREDLINSAVSFLQDPSVASAPLEKRIAFLQSKNLTQEEIDLSLARAADSSGAPAPPAQSSPPSNYAYRQQPPPPPQGYGAYPGYWQQPPPPEVPKRDWRDWFIMATVLGGVGYGVYFTAKRYIVPLIAPPTPPQLEQDKAAIDVKFDRAFALLEQLEADTKALKAAEEERTQRLDAALAEMETVITSLKDSSRRRDDDSRRMEDDIRNLGLLVPKALDAHKESTASQLRELGTELKSLKTLVSNRVGSAPATTARPGSGAGAYGVSSGSAVGHTVNGTASPSATPVEASNSGATQSAGSGADASTTSTNQAEQPRPYSPYGRLTNGRASIPAWQMAAAKKSQDQDGAEKKDTSESGTVTEASTGA